MCGVYVEVSSVLMFVPVLCDVSNTATYFVGLEEDLWDPKKSKMTCHALGAATTNAGCQVIGSETRLPGRKSD